MRPVLQESKIKKMWILYIAILIICIIGIGIALYLQFFQNEKIEIVFGITDTEEEDTYNELKEEFKTTLFTNKFENIQQEELEIEKIKDEYDIVITAHTYTANEENKNMNVSVPYINIKKEDTVKFNKKMQETYEKQAKTYKEQNSTVKVIYTVEYIAYLQDNILSIVIRSEIKEGSKSQKATIETFNYDLINDKEVTINDLLILKNISTNDANSKIKDEIKEIQEQNQALVEQGYNIHQRDYTSEIYDINNASQYFLGKDQMLYVIYAYGNDEYTDNEDTNDMDVIIFK